jgi:hypothetical protein
VSIWFLWWPMNSRFNEGCTVYQRTLGPHDNLTRALLLQGLAPQLPVEDSCSARGEPGTTGGCRRR